jgi:hypothetical protein
MSVFRPALLVALAAASLTQAYPPSKPAPNKEGLQKAAVLRNPWGNRGLVRIM